MQRPPKSQQSTPTKGGMSDAMQNTKRNRTDNFKWTATCRRDGSLSHLLISASPPSGTDATRSRLPCHPPSWLGAASHLCFHYLRPQQPISHTWPHHCLPGRPSANDAAVFQRSATARGQWVSSPERRARVVRVSVAPRIRRVYRGLDFIISKWASYFSCRSLICNPFMSLRRHCSKVASLA
jgi:hypothetical protein